VPGLAPDKQSALRMEPVKPTRCDRASTCAGVDRTCLSSNAVVTRVVLGPLHRFASRAHSELSEAGGLSFGLAARSRGSTPADSARIFARIVRFVSSGPALWFPALIGPLYCLYLLCLGLPIDEACRRKAMIETRWSDAVSARRIRKRPPGKRKLNAVAAP
jgi:hypothetical protein